MIPQLRRGQRQNSQATTMLASIKGINAVTSLARMDPEECIYMSNILPEDFGCEVRDGYIEWANGWTGGAAKTVIPFEGNVSGDDRLFVASPEGIFDVSTQGETAPVQVVTFPSSALKAGICHSVNFGNDAGDRFLLVTDGENGYYTWTQTTDTWAKIAEGGGGIVGVDPALFNYVMIWKQRVWFIERDTGLAYFISKAEGFLGTAIPFNFGTQFRFGGPLVSLHNWTLDGGAGIDDYLVGISGAGDAIVFQGSDPTSAADFGLVGSWYVGELPAGNRVASEFSGELYILSVQGLLAMSQVLNSSFSTANESSYITNKVSPYIRAIMDDVENDFGWHVHVHPKQSLLYVNTPPVFGRPQEAFTLYFGHESWGIVGGLNKSHTANWRGQIYWTDINLNKIYIQAGDVDGVHLDQELDGPPQGIDWEVLGAFSDLGQPAQYKRVQYIRPMFSGDGDPPVYDVRAQYDFDLSRVNAPPAFTGGTAALWGNAGNYLFSLESDGADVLALSVQDGTIQLGGVTTIDVTIGTHPLATLTWNVPNLRYEGASVGIQAYLVSEIGNPLATTINPDILASGAYTLTPAGFGADAGFRPPLFEISNDPLPPPTNQGFIQPAAIFGTGVSLVGEGSWNIAQWSGGVQSNDVPHGGNGLGRHVAMNIRGRTAAKTTLIAFDVIWDVGGLM